MQPIAANAVNMPNNLPQLTPAAGAAGQPTQQQSQAMAIAFASVLNQVIAAANENASNQ